MATAASALPKFPGPIGTKRRRMRSGGNVSTLTNNAPKLPPPPPADDEDPSEAKTAQTSKCKGATTIPIFLKKTYKMIDTCDPNVASWTADGEMFVVKDPDTFAAQIIPQYFDHNKFSSFARQLNFYGFRKMQSKPIRNSDYDAGTAKHVTFFNENFKRGRCDLLKKIQRSTRGGGATSGQDQQREVQGLKDQIASLEQKLADVTEQVEERMRRLELDMLSRMEQMMIAMQQQQQTQLQLQTAASIGTNGSSSNSRHSSHTVPTTVPTNSQRAWEMSVLADPRQGSIGLQNAVAAAGMNSVMNGSMNSVGGFQQPQPLSKTAAPAAAAPTLPPHPKQKQLPVGGIFPVGSVGVPNARLHSLRGISTLSRNFSLSRGQSVESSASAVLMRNSWEDKFFSMLMLGEQEQAQAQNGVHGAANHDGFVAPNSIQPMGNGIVPGVNAPAAVSDNSNDKNQDDMSDVSGGEIA